MQQDKDKVESQKKRLDFILKSEMKLYTATDISQQPDCKEEEVLADQQLWNQERNSMTDQNDSEPPEVKEEQKEFCISQEGKLLVGNMEADTFIVTLISEENQQSETELNGEQLLSHKSAVTEIQDDEGSWHVDSGSKPKKRRLKTRRHSDSNDDSLASKILCENETESPQLHDGKKEVLTVQQVWNQERDFTLDQEKQDTAHVKEEEHLGLKQESDTFMVTPTDEDNDSSETEPNSELSLPHNSPAPASQDHGAE
ncbi:uncharacterized protein KZ484_011038 [Pholidichthys leucotaenia]